MKKVRQSAPSGFQDLEALRAMIIHLSEMRDAEALGLRFPPPTTPSRPRREGTDPGAP